MFEDAVKGKRCRHVGGLVAFMIIVGGCGGGGAAVGAGGTTGPADGTDNPPTAPPPASSAITVTTPNETFSPRVTNIASGGSVTWQFSGARHNVTFGSLKPTGGDVPDTDAGGAATRTFATGTYDYQCTRHSGMTGQVIVGPVGSTTPPPATPPPATPPPANPPASPGSVVQATPRSFSPERIEIAPGGTVTWEFSGGTFGIVFEDDAPDGGNIPETSPGSKVPRTFSAEGDYDYYSSKNRDVKGRIRVR